VEDCRERWAAATCIQNYYRMGQARRRVMMVIKARKAIKIQALARGVLAREAIARKRRWFAAQFDNETRMIVKIQNAYRTKLARGKMEMRKRIADQREQESAMLMQKMQRGRKTRMDYQKKKVFRMQLEHEKVEQNGASLMIQGKFRQRKARGRVTMMRKGREDEDMAKGASRIQAMHRGRKGRSKAEEARRKREREEEERRLGKYFVMRRDYLQEQEREHGVQVREIQSAARIYLSKRMVARMLKLKKADLEKAEQVR
jgi:hypothetical protein